MTSNKQRVNYSRQHFIGTLVGVAEYLWLWLTVLTASSFFSLKIIFLASNLSLLPFTAAFLFFFFSFFHFARYPHRHIYCCCCAAVTVPAAGECQHSYILCACVNTFEAWFGVCVGDIRHLWQCDIIHRKRTEHEMFCTHKNAYIPLTNAHTHTPGHRALCGMLAAGMCLQIASPHQIPHTECRILFLFWF